eukprot:1369307-Amphidinium_carterae.2
MDMHYGTTHEAAMAPCQVSPADKVRVGEQPGFHAAGEAGCDRTSSLQHLSRLTCPNGTRQM